ncbi:hypothetical protein LCGC14_1502210 [marine sediment metagenome]|uniref:GIY-YIG domain-containing protein n=1 Tax=marine sediment metagenome TaxID=412755 RepID=A0A0F9JPP2_9ZZZZ
MNTVYAIGFPNGKLYVGITSQTVAKRLNEHIRNSRRGMTYAIHHALRKYGRNVRLIVLAQDVSWAEAQDLEIWWISRLSTLHGPGYNLTAGGEGTLNRKFTTEALAKMSKAAMGNQRCKGRKYTKEARRKMSRAQIERVK